MLILAACAPVSQEVVSVPEPIFEPPVVQVPEPIIIVERTPIPLGNVNDFVINSAIHPYSLVSTNAVLDNFAIIPVVRYDAEYHSDIAVLVHLFKFSSRQELDVVLNSEFYEIIDRGASFHRGQSVAVYLPENDHRTVIWPSGTLLVYIETFLPNFAAVEIVDAYLRRYPSDLETDRCIDSDGRDHFLKGTTTRVQIGSTIMEWEDVCLKDFAAYRNGQYRSRKGLNPEDGLLEGRCVNDLRMPGFVDEYACPKSCENGACK